MRYFIYALALLIGAVHAQLVKVPCERCTPLDESGKERRRNHKGHYPFISHLTFRNACDIVIDEFVEWFDSDVVQRGDSIYLNVWYLEWFIEHVHDRIKHPYILVTCDMGNSLPAHFEAQKLLHDPKCAMWFGRNLIFSNHPKLIQIPMGQDLTLFDRGTEDLVKACAKKANTTKNHLLYMNHYPRPWGDRDKIVKLFEHAPYCLTQNHSDRAYAMMPLPLTKYYDDLLSSQFVLSPLGLETDCVRTWEALALGCIPIVEHNFIDPVFEGLPVVFVHNWEEIDERFLKEKYEQLKDLPHSDKIYFDYWNNQIKDAQRRIRNQDMQCARLETLCFDETDLSDLSDILQEYGADDKRRVNLFYRGCLSGVRALQLAFEMPFISRFCLHDVWLDRGIWDNLEYYLMDHNLLMWRNKIDIADSEESFNSMLNSRNQKGTAVFLDLAYFRHALYWDINNYPHRLRHSLKRDIQNVIRQLKSEVLLCGNMRHDDYVKEVLAQLSQENAFAIKTKGNFWFLIACE